MQAICRQNAGEMQAVGRQCAGKVQAVGRQNAGNLKYFIRMKQMDSQKKILSEIQSKKKHRGGMLGQHRHLLIEMTKKYFTQKEMAEMLKKIGAKISRQSISDYLIKMPITMEELNGKNESGSVNLNQWKNQKTSKKKKEKKVFFNLDKPF